MPVPLSMDCILPPSQNKSLPDDSWPILSPLVLPRHRAESRPSIQQRTAGGWPRPSSPQPAPRGRWPRPPPACADRRRTPRLPPATMRPSQAPSAGSAAPPGRTSPAATPLPSSLPGAAELCGADGPRCGQLPAEARRAAGERTEQ